MAGHPPHPTPKHSASRTPQTLPPIPCCPRYGGSVFRPNIAEQADWYVMDIHDILTALPEP